MSHCKILSSFYTTQSREGRAAACRNCEVGQSVSSIWSLLVMDEKAQKRPHDDGEFDAVIFQSRNDTQGEAGMGSNFFPVPKFRMLLLVLKKPASMMNP